jgi:hypothetical protein
MKRKLTLTLIAIPLLVMLSVAIMGQTSAQIRIPGVKTQDSFVYHIADYWDSELADDPAPSYLDDFNATRDYEVLIGGVSDLFNITMTNVWTFTNGTENAYLIIIDVQSGTTYYLSSNIPPFEAVVGGGLVPGDVLHPGGNDTTILVNQTIDRQYADGPRATNIVTLTTQFTNDTTDAEGNAVQVVTGFSNVTYALDKATGMLVEETIYSENYIPHETLSITWTLVKTSVWNASAPSNGYDPLSTAIAIGIIAVIAAVSIVYFIRRGRHGRH